MAHRRLVYNVTARDISRSLKIIRNSISSGAEAFSLNEGIKDKIKDTSI